jgi:hypothetical protein
MKLLPRIRLRTVFVIFLCAAAGLAIGTSPKREANDPLLTILGWHDAQLNWHYALLSAASIAMLIGLLHQVAYLWNWKRTGVFEYEAEIFAVRYAIAWRLAIAILIITCLATAMLLARRFTELPDSEAFFTYEPFPYAIWAMCLIAVLSSSLDRWRRRNGNRSDPLLRNAALWIVGSVMAILILLDVTFVHFLVHIAINGIEQAQSARYQIVGLFPDHRAEGFRTFWISAVAVAILLWGAGSIVLVNKSRLERRRRFVIGLCAYLLSLMILTAYCIWYFGFELYRISPYLAGAGICSNRLERSTGVVLAVILITIGAHRLSKATNSHLVCDSNLPKATDIRWIHENPICLLILTGSVVIYVYTVTWTFLSIPNPFRSSVVAEVIVGILRESGGLLMAAICILSLQLGWLCWRRQNERVEWRIAAVDRRQFFWNWIALALLAAIGIPTTCAFLFMFWLGPWYLYGR